MAKGEPPVRAEVVEAQGTVIGFPAPRAEPVRDLPSIVVTVTPSRALRAARPPAPFNPPPVAQSTVQTAHANDVGETEPDLGLGKLSFVQLRGKRSKLLIGSFLLSLMLAAGGLGRWLGAKLLPDDEPGAPHAATALVTSVPATARVRTPEPDPVPATSAPAVRPSSSRAASGPAELHERTPQKSSAKPTSTIAQSAKSPKTALPELEAKPGSVFDTPLRPPAE